MSGLRPNSRWCLGNAASTRRWLPLPRRRRTHGTSVVSGAHSVEEVEMFVADNRLQWEKGMPASATRVVPNPPKVPEVPEPSEPAQEVESQRQEELKERAQAMAQQAQQLERAELAVKAAELQAAGEALEEAGHSLREKVKRVAMMKKLLVQQKLDRIAVKSEIADTQLQIELKEGKLEAAYQALSGAAVEKARLRWAHLQAEQELGLMRKELIHWSDGLGNLQRTMEKLEEDVEAGTNGAARQVPGSAAAAVNSISAMSLFWGGPKSAGGSAAAATQNGAGSGKEPSSTVKPEEEEEEEEEEGMQGEDAAARRRREVDEAVSALLQGLRNLSVLVRQDAEADDLALSHLTRLEAIGRPDSHSKQNKRPPGTDSR